jgi:guanylate kinase
VSETKANNTPAPRGRVLVISGPSGVGKSTICHRLCAQLPAEFSVSWTTRPPRPGEIDGVDYHFVDAAAFDRLLGAQGFAEHAEVYGRRYGTPREPIERALVEGRTIILEIDIHGAVQVRRRYPAARMAFLLPPTPHEQARRITGRRTDSQDEIARRLERADGEIRYAQEAGVYDRFLINETVEETVAALRGWLEKGA